MPTQHVVTSYKFEELSDKAKEKARDWFRQGALDYEWWEGTYDDAANIGLKITGFDLGRAQTVEGKWDKSAVDVAAAILKDHGDTCQTYVEALAFTLSFQDEPTEEQETEFLRAIRRCYWGILNAEAEYLTSDECVDEVIAANDYDFDINGNRFRY